MSTFAITSCSQRDVHYLVMFNYSGGEWKLQFRADDLFRPVTLPDRHSAYNLINLLISLEPDFAGYLDVEEIDLDG